MTEFIQNHPAAVIFGVGIFATFCCCCGGGLIGIIAWFLKKAINDLTGIVQKLHDAVITLGQGHASLEARQQAQEDRCNRCVQSGTYPRAGGGV